jgi:ATP-binding cassette subfamily B (MDR/TAP) protein 1
MSVMTILAHISSVSVPLTAATNAIKAAQIFFSIIDAPKPSTIGVQEEVVSFTEEIVLEDVNFAYPARHSVKILKNVSLRIPAGKTTAIVGPSGSGKSTILALILRWYELGEFDPIANYLRNGTIKIGSRNLKEIDLRWWRSNIGLVQQEPFLFNDTILTNVAYGLVGTEYEYASENLKYRLVTAACKEAYADEFIRTLPEVRAQHHLCDKIKYDRAMLRKWVTGAFSSAAVNANGLLLPGLSFGSPTSWSLMKPLVH